MAARRILIVEDETMISMMVEDFLADLGWDVVGVAGTLDQALVMAQEAALDAALLDLNLHGQNTFGVAEILQKRQIPLVFATGYGAQGIESRFRAIPTLTKPYRRDELESALHQALAAPHGLDGRCPDPGPSAPPGKPTLPG